jgi:hypothetical protein
LRRFDGEFEGWSNGDEMALLTDAYNAFTVEKTLTRYDARR